MRFLLDVGFFVRCICVFVLKLTRNIYIMARAVSLLISSNVDNYCASFIFTEHIPQAVCVCVCAFVYNRIFTE